MSASATGGPRGALVVALVALCSLGVVACGGDDEGTETEVTAPELTIPGGSSATIPDETETTTGTDTTGSGSGSGTAAPGGSGGTATPPATPQQPPAAGGGGPAGGAQPPDNPQNDTPPPQGSPAERFEQFCQDNPGACGN